MRVPSSARSTLEQRQSGTCHSGKGAYDHTRDGPGISDGSRISALFESSIFGICFSTSLSHSASSWWVMLFGSFVTGVRALLACDFVRAELLLMHSLPLMWPFAMEGKIESNSRSSARCPTQRGRFIRGGPLPKDTVAS